MLSISSEISCKGLLYCFFKHTSLFLCKEYPSQHNLDLCIIFNSDVLFIENIF